MKVCTQKQPELSREGTCPEHNMNVLMSRNVGKVDLTTCQRLRLVADTTADIDGTRNVVQASDVCLIRKTGTDESGSHV